MPVPFVFRGQHGRAEHVEKTVHLGMYLVPVLPDRVMLAGCEIDRDLMGRRRDQCLGDLLRSWKRIGSNSAGAQLETESGLIDVGIEFRQQRDSLFRSLRRRFPKRWQISDEGTSFFQKCKLDIVREEHFKLND